MLIEASINITGLAAVISTSAFALQNVDPDRHNKKARLLLALNLLAPRAGFDHSGRNLRFLPGSPPLRIPDAGRGWDFSSLFGRWNLRFHFMLERGLGRVSRFPPKQF